MFPYPSGSGLHVGHPEGYTATDILARYYRRKGYNVLHPMGWDSFGLPAEQYALKTGTHPEETTQTNINRFRKQLQALGLSYDWKREIETSNKDYYRWTQWIFIQLWKRGLAYEDNKPVNWCPQLGTVLANEEVIDGLSERGGYPVERRPMRQWVLKITEYAERLLQDLDELDWPESIKDMQRNWIGKSVGAEINFPVINKRERDSDDTTILDPISVFTTRPETIGGVSYLVVAPEYPNLEKLVSSDQKQHVDSYVKAAFGKSERDRTGEKSVRIKSGVPTGSFARNPVTGEEVPIWVADYVVGGYGTGAVMAVPAHDTRDFEFAKTFNLPIKQVIASKDTGGKQKDDALSEAYTGAGVMMSWNGAGGLELDGVSSVEAKDRIVNTLEELKAGRRRVNYKLRDWLFSRQRYWGEPFPIVFIDGVATAVDESELPIELPSVESYQPCGTGESPLASVKDWVEMTLPDGRKARRETNTMPQWAGSCWYYLRFIDPTNPGKPVDPELEKYWMPVDLYVGGVEHAVLHLLYARFWHKVLYDCGIVSTKEPFARLVNQGMILGEVEYTAYQTLDKEFVSSSAVDEVNKQVTATGAQVVPVRIEGNQVVKQGEHFVFKDDSSIRLNARAHKMSKSRGNVVNPDRVIDEYGADALRCYLMFLGPLEQVKPWTTSGVQGMSRFLARVWRLVVDSATNELQSSVKLMEATRDQRRLLHHTIKKVTLDTEQLRFNTAISSMIEFVNAATKWNVRPREILEPFVGLLSPYAPHIAEELWSRLGMKSGLTFVEWPEYKKEYDVADERTIVVQVNGKVRSRMQVSVSADKNEIMKRALTEERVLKYTDGMQVRKQIYVPGKLVNLVVTQ